MKIRGNSEFINRWIEIIHSKQQGGNTEKNNEYSLKDICDNTKGLTFVSLKSQKMRKNILIKNIWGNDG